MVSFTAEDIALPAIDEQQIRMWLRKVAAFHGFGLGDVTYIFCSDKRILEVNRQFLEHDYFTDVITFDYSTSATLSGDVYISLDTVYSNAKELNIDPHQELLRIIVHALLHLTGQGDKTPETKVEMTRKEDEALTMLPI